MTRHGDGPRSVLVWLLQVIVPEFGGNRAHELEWSLGRFTASRATLTQQGWGQMARRI